MRDYLRARESFIELQAISYETADPNDEARAIQAEEALGKTLNTLNTLMNEH